MKPLTGTLIALSVAIGLAGAAFAQPAGSPPPAPGAAPSMVQPAPPPQKPKPKPKPRPLSFECRDAFSDAEKMVCKSFDLAKLDGQMYRAYMDYTDSLGPDQELAHQSAELAQRRWVIARDQCRDEYCVRNVYEDRIRTLRGQHSNNMGLRRP